MSSPKHMARRILAWPGESKSLELAIPAILSILDDSTVGGIDLSAGIGTSPTSHGFRLVIYRSRSITPSQTGWIPDLVRNIV